MRFMGRPQGAVWEVELPGGWKLQQASVRVRHYSRDWNLPGEPHVCPLVLLKKNGQLPARQRMAMRLIMTTCSSAQHSEKTTFIDV